MRALIGAGSRRSKVKGPGRSGFGREARTGVDCRAFRSPCLGKDDDLDERVYVRWLVRDLGFKAVCYAVSESERCS